MSEKPLSSKPPRNHHRTHLNTEKGSAIIRIITILFRKITKSKCITYA